MCTAPFLSCGKIMWPVGAPSGAPSPARAQPRAGLRTPPAGPRLVSDHPMIVGSNRGLDLFKRVPPWSSGEPFSMQGPQSPRPTLIGGRHLIDNARLPRSFRSHWRPVHSLGPRRLHDALWVLSRERPSLGRRRQGPDRSADQHWPACSRPASAAAGRVRARGRRGRRSDTTPERASPPGRPPAGRAMPRPVDSRS